MFMKKIFLPIFTMLVLCSSATSCNESNDELTQQENKTMVTNNSVQRSGADLGTLHNRALDLYYSNNTPDGTKTNFVEALKKITSYMQEYDSSYFKDVDTQVLIDRYNRFKSFTSQRGNVNAKDGDYAETHDLLDFLKQNNEISNMNYDFLVTNLLNANDNDTKLSSINNYVSSNELSEQDIEQIETVKSVFISSDQYWETSTYSKGDPKSRAVIIADCVGGLLWAETGPFAVIGAAACSLIANEA